MAFQPVKARCRNCKKLYTKTRENQSFCQKKCRDNFHNYGKTPLEQVTRRFKAWMRTPDFKVLVHDAIRKEMRSFMVTADGRGGLQLKSANAGESQPLNRTP